MSRSVVVLALAAILATGSARVARAQDVVAVGGAVASPRHHVFLGLSKLRNTTTKSSAIGPAAELGYDYAFTPSSRVGLLADVGVDGGYGADADGFFWGEIAARYSYLFRFQAVPRIVPFLSGGLAVGHTGGYLSTTGPYASLMLDAGVELVVFQALALDLRFTERPARLSLPGTSWHNAAGVVADLAFVF